MNLQNEKTAFLINTSRGPIVNEDDLIIALLQMKLRLELMFMRKNHYKHLTN